MLQFFINNEEIICQRKNVIQENILEPTSLTLQNCYPKAWDNKPELVNNFFYPEPFSKVLIKDDGNIIFAGAVKNTGDISLNFRDPKYANIQVIDFKTLLSEGEQLDFVIQNKTILQAIEQIINAVSSYGFIKGNIELDNLTEKIGAYNCQNKTAYDVLQYIAEISQARWFTRLINENQIAIDFYTLARLPRKANIEYTKQWCCDNEISDIKYNISSYDYRNEQIIISDKIMSNVQSQEIMYGDGYNTTFHTEQKIGRINSIKVNGQTKTWVTQAEKAEGITADFYYVKGQNQIESDVQYSRGTRVEINYNAIVNGRQTAINTDEQTRIETLSNRKGLISRYEVRNDIADSNQLKNVAETYLNLKGNAEVTLKILTTRNLYNIGDKVFFNIPQITQLQQDYIVKNKKTTIIGDKLQIFYEFTLSSNYGAEDIINYFDNQRRKVSGNIEEGNVIIRNIDINNTATIIWDDLRIEEEEVRYNNILNCGLNASLVQ